MAGSDWEASCSAQVACCRCRKVAGCVVTSLAARTGMIYLEKPGGMVRLGSVASLGHLGGTIEVIGTRVAKCDEFGLEGRYSAPRSTQLIQTGERSGQPAYSQRYVYLFRTQARVWVVYMESSTTCACIPPYHHNWRPCCSLEKHIHPTSFATDRNRHLRRL